MKKPAALLTLFLALALCMAACTADKPNQGEIRVVTQLAQTTLVGDIPCAFPLAKDGAEMNAMICGYDGVNTEDVYVWKQYQQITGVRVNWTTVQKKDRSEAV